MITPEKRLAVVFIRFQFEIIKAIGMFWLIERIPFLKIKEPFNRLYQRSKKFNHN